MGIHVPSGIPTIGLLGVTLHSFNMSMTVESCSGGSCKDISLGYFGTPETHLKLGNNHANWDVGAKLLDSSSLLNEFILPMFLENKTVSLVLGSDDVSMLLRFTVLPLPFS